MTPSLNPEEREELRRLFPEHDPDAPDPEPEDHSNPPPMYMRGSRRGSGTWKARMTTWDGHCALDILRDSMPESDFLVMTVLLNTASKKGTDVLTIARREVADIAGIPQGSIQRVLVRLEKEGWLAVVERGTSGRGGSGRAAKIRLLGAPTSSTRRGDSKAFGRTLRGTPQADHVPPDGPSGTDASHPLMAKTYRSTKDSQNPLGNHLYLVVSGSVWQPVTQSKLSADAWLSQALAWGPMHVRDLVALGKRGGYSRRTLERAAQRIGVVKANAVGPSGGKGKPPRISVTWELP